jgi:uncharacterized protein
MTKNGGVPDEHTLRDIVQGIVDAVGPELVILFGSAARGEMSSDSDLDFLVVKAGVHRRKTAQAIGRHLIGVAPEDIERYRDTIGFIIRPALREGRIVYAAGP